MYHWWRCPHHGLTGPEERRAEHAGPGRAGGRERRGERPAGLGRVVKKKEKASWAGPCERKGRKGKKKERVGQAQREKDGEKEMHSNIFEFKFKI
jgi:hypothetical protein